NFQIRNPNSEMNSLLDFQHAVVPTVDDVQDSGRADVHAVRLIHFELTGRTADPGGSLVSRSRDLHKAAVFDQVLADHVVVGVGDDHVAVAVEAQVLRAAESGFERRTVGHRG